MVIDSSALVAVLFGEPEAERLTTALAADPVRCISAFSVLETSIVLYRRKGAEAVAEFEALLADLGIEIVPFDAIQARAARVAYERFGKGLHPASLNLGDCCSYALASIRKQPSTKVTTFRRLISRRLRLVRPSLPRTGRKTAD